MKKLNLLSVIASLSIAKTITLLPFGAYLNYSGSTYKDSGYAAGIYMSYYDVLPKYNSGLKLELNLENDYIDYENNIKDYRSFGTTFMFNWFYGFNYMAKVGINHQNIDNSGNDEHSNVYIVGFKYYKYLKYNFGVDFYKTIYDKKYDTININQITPFIGFNFGNYYSLIGSFYFEAKYNYIFSNEVLATKKDYNNFEFKLSNFKGKFTTTLSACVGRTAYKVENGGFVFYNTGNEYKNIYSLSFSYAYNPTTSIKATYKRSNFIDNGNSHNDLFMLSLTKGFKI